MDYFKLIGIEKRYDIDLKLLNNQYLKMQSENHPDLENNITKKQQKIIIASDLNKAYTILKDDVARAKYLLLLNGINIDGLENRTLLPHDKLHEFWKDLEKCDILQEKSDLQLMYDEKVSYKKEMMDKLRVAFLTNKLNDAAICTITLKYLINLINKIESKLKTICN